MTWSRVCVFCGSSSGRDAVYREAAAALGCELAGRGVGVVFGGGRVGLMGVLADAALAAGGEVIGVIPRALVAREVAHAGLSDLRVVETMHERKALMAELSDAFVTLPGGVGSMEETFEVMTWAQLGIHGKPCGLLNVAGFYDPLLRQLDRFVAEGFVKREHRDLLVVGDTVGGLLDALAAARPVRVAKWLELEQT
jgi:uncharacterized protein (TIGR00730 family)